MSVTLQGEARLRVLSLYKAWRRHIPIMCKDFDIPRTEAQCQAALRSIWHPITPHIASFHLYPTKQKYVSFTMTCFGRREFLKHARVRDIRVIDMTIIKVSVFSSVERLSKLLPFELVFVE